MIFVQQVCSTILLNNLIERKDCWTTLFLCNQQILTATLKCSIDEKRTSSDVPDRLLFDDSKLWSTITSDCIHLTVVERRVMKLISDTLRVITLTANQINDKWNENNDWHEWHTWQLVDYTTKKTSWWTLCPLPHFHLDWRTLEWLRLFKTFLFAGESLYWQKVSSLVKCCCLVVETCYELVDDGGDKKRSRRSLSSHFILLRLSHSLAGISIQQKKGLKDQLFERRCVKNFFLTSYRENERGW